METLNLKNNNESLIFKILHHENEIFEEFIKKRKTFLQNVKKNTLNECQMKHFIYDVKSIIDSMKSTNNFIEQYFVNSKNHFNNDYSMNETQFIQFYFFFKDFFFISRESSESSELSESVSNSSESFSDSEPSDSVSDSVSDSPDSPDSLSV